MEAQAPLVGSSGLTTGMAIKSLHDNLWNYEEGNTIYWFFGGPFYGKYMMGQADRVNDHNNTITSLGLEILRKSCREETIPPKHLARVYEYLSNDDLARLNLQQILKYITPTRKKDSSVLEKLLAREALQPQYQQVCAFLQGLPQRDIDAIRVDLKSQWLKECLKGEPELLEAIGKFLSEEQRLALQKELEAIGPAPSSRQS